MIRRHLLLIIKRSNRVHLIGYADTSKLFAGTIVLVERIEETKPAPFWCLVTTNLFQGGLDDPDFIVDCIKLDTLHVQINLEYGCVAKSVSC